MNTKGFFFVVKQEICGPFSDMERMKGITELLKGKKKNVVYAKKKSKN